MRNLPLHLSGPRWSGSYALIRRVSGRRVFSLTRRIRHLPGGAVCFSDESEPFVIDSRSRLHGAEPLVPLIGQGGLVRADFLPLSELTQGGLGADDYVLDLELLSSEGVDDSVSIPFSVSEPSGGGRSNKK